MLQEVLKMIFLKTNTAHANIQGNKQHPNINGQVEFKETKNGVLLTAKIYGLPTSPNKCQGRFFGFHIHGQLLLRYALTHLS